MKIFRSGQILWALMGLAIADRNHGGTAEVPGSRPNIVFVLADDLGYGDPRCYNPASKIPTPNMDRLAAEGIRFLDAHTPSSVCTPTRYGIMTGRYCWRSRMKSGVLNGYDPFLIERGRLTVPALLRREGYSTAGIGKWHLGLGETKPADFAGVLRPGPISAGFDYFFGIPASLDMPPYVFFENERVTMAPTNQIGASEMRRKGGGGFWREGAIAPGFRHEGVLPTITARAVQYIRERPAGKGKPFFLYFALTAPHTPWMPTADFRGRSGAGFYGDFVAQVDASLGEVLRGLDDRGLRENTLVIFTSDNGAHWLPEDIKEWNHRANDGWRGQKADLWDGGHRVPFLARWPGRIKAGTTSDEVICLTDLMATAAALCGTRLPREAGEDSANILPALFGEQIGKPIHEAVVHHSSDGTFAIRQGPWKLEMGLGSHGFSLPINIVPKTGEATGQLYNILADPGETNNLWLQRPEIVKRLTKLIEKYKKEGRSQREIPKLD